LQLLNKLLDLQLYTYILIAYFHLQIPPKRLNVSDKINGTLNIDNPQEFPASSLTSDRKRAMHYQMSAE